MPTPSHIEMRIITTTIIVLALALTQTETLIIDSSPIQPVEKAKKVKMVNHTKKQEKPHISFGVPTGCESYASEVSKYDWNASLMLKIMKAESGCNPVNHNYADKHKTCLGSFGLFQIGCVHGYTVSELENPSVNIKTAYHIWLGQGYSAWGAYTNGSYLDL